MQRTIEKNIHNDLSIKLLDESKKAIGAPRLIDFKLIETLIENGADMHYQDEDGNTFMHYLCVADYADFSITLPENINKISSKFYIDIKLIKNILKKGVNVNIQNNAEATCLHSALNHLSYNAILIMLLIEYGADLNIKAKHNYLRQACNYLSNYPKLEIIKFLSTRVKDAEKILLEDAPEILRAIAEHALYNPNSEQFNDLGILILANIEFIKLKNITLPIECSATRIYKMIELLKTVRDFKEVIEFLESLKVGNLPVLQICRISKDMREKNNFFAPCKNIKQKIGRYLQKTPEEMIEKTLEKFSSIVSNQPKI